jgi:iron-sulfur cluster assembly protein
VGNYQSAYYTKRKKARKGDSMLTLTPAAVEKVKAILTERGEEGGLRIAVVGGGCSGFQYQMSLDKEAGSEDQIIDQDGLKVFVDARSMPYLSGTKVDYVDGLSGSGFKFENPNAQSSCGCGESFNA